MVRSLDLGQFVEASWRCLVGNFSIFWPYQFLMHRGAWRIPGTRWSGFPTLQLRLKFLYGRLNTKGILRRKGVTLGEFLCCALADWGISGITFSLLSMCSSRMALCALLFLFWWMSWTSTRAWVDAARHLGKETKRGQLYSSKAS